MKSLKLTIISVGLVIFLVGCSSPKDASKNNFKKVINAYLEKNCIRVSLWKSDFPVIVELLPDDNLETILYPNKLKQYDALVSIGFLEAKDGTAEINKNMFSNKIITVQTKVYSLTEKGNQAFQQTTQKGFFGGANKGFCAGKYKINDVTNFSEPSQSGGHTISNVDFSISPYKINDWANSQIIVDAFPQLAKKLEENQFRSTTLVLMNDGWIHNKEMKK